MNRNTLKQKIKSYFDIYLPENEGEIADIESFAVYLGVTREELAMLEADKKYGRDIALARSKIASIKKQLAFKGRIPAAVLSFDFKNNHGYKDKAESDGHTAASLIIQGEAQKWSE